MINKEITALEAHEYANLFPMIQGDEFDSLVSDIKTNGLMQKIWLFDGKILDGRNRLKACIAAGVTPEFQQYQGDDPLAFVISLNLKRRHLETVDLCRLVENVEALYAKEANDKKLSTLKQNQSTPDEAALPHREPANKAKDHRDPQARDKAVATIDNAISGRTLQDYKRLKKAAGQHPDILEQVINKDISVNAGIKELKKREKSEKLKQKKKQVAKNLKKSVEQNKPKIQVCSYADHDLKECDLLITDPPYSTDVENVFEFARDWLKVVLPKVKPDGRAYICIGAYPEELNAYLSILLNEYRHFTVDNPLIWTYRNTLGVTPKGKYNLNYQVILHLYQKDTPPLDASITNEMFSVQDINAPDGRQGDRFHAWQKPIELGMRLVRHGSQPGATVYDPFACTGTFLIAAAKQDRKAIGCEISPDNANIAQQRGCHVI